MTPERAEYGIATTVDALVSALENQTRLNEMMTGALESLREDVNALSARVESVTRTVIARETNEAMGL